LSRGVAVRGRWIAGAAGGLLPLSFAPFGQFCLAPVLVAVLFWTWSGQGPREAGWRGFWFGFAAFGAGTYWLYISIRIFGQAPLVVALGLMLGLVAVMALYLGLLGSLLARLKIRSQAFAWCLVWPAGWVLVEWLRGWLFTGFPWLTLGYGQIDGPLAGWGAVGGVYAVSAIAAVAGGLLLTGVAGTRRQQLGALAGLALIAATTAVLSGRAWTFPEGQQLRVALVQGSISQDRKWLPEQRRPTLELYRRLSFEGEPVDLVVWPEVAVPAMAHEVEGYLGEIRTAALAADRQVILGILSFDFDLDQYHNSLLVLGSRVDVYHKRHLVPFGEFFPVPDFVREWMRLMSLPYRDAAPGDRDQPPLEVDGLQLAPSICYEDAFGAEQLDFLPEADLLVNVSNDAWFGDSIAPHQHLQIARMRALETGRYMLRATNTGITALIGPDGGLIARSPQFETVVLRGTVRAHGGATPYARTGNWPVVALAVVVLLGAGLLRRRG
jgi:apolipoprotein N-acyltransferase